MGNNKSTLTLRTNDVFVDVNSGLGNQLFMIATAYAYSLRHNKNLVLANNIRSKYTYWNNILYKCNGYLKNQSYKNIKSQQYYAERKFTYTNIPLVKKNLYMKGFFQSELYFKDYEKEIRQLFELPVDLRTFVNQQFKKWLIFDNEIVVAVHIRRGDYLKLSDKHTIQPISYFNEAKQTMLDTIGGPIRFMYFSDDTDWVRKMMDIRSKDIVVSGFKDYEDFALMQNCHHFIITNSTFSWWGAWLSKSFERYLKIPNNVMLKDIKVSEKFVIAPSQWFGDKGPKNWDTVYSDKWKVLNSVKKSIDDLFHLSIITDEKTLAIERKHMEQHKNIPFKYNYFIGNNENEYNTDIIKLNYIDSTTGIYQKTYNMLKYIINARPEIEYIIVANENAKFNFEAFKFTVNRVYDDHIHYAGILIKGQKVDYCKYDCYFLSKKAINVILRFHHVDERIKDEEKIAYCLKNANIEATNITNIAKSIYA
jgi:hypothetical protein